MTRESQLRAAGAILLAALLWSVPLSAEPLIPVCGFHWLTGRPCPLCGLTRALFALGKGNWTQATHLNALSPLGLVMLFSLFWGGPLRASLWKIGITAFAIYGVYRVTAG